MAKNTPRPIKKRDIEIIEQQLARHDLRRQMPAGQSRPGKYDEATLERQLGVMGPPKVGRSRRRRAR